MEFNLHTVKFVNCTFTLEDVEDVLRGRLNREPTLEEVLAVVKNIDEDSMLNMMHKAGWDAIYKALDKFYKEV